MKRISSGGQFEERFGYCRAVVAGGFVHVAGTTAQGSDIPEDIETQCAMALETIGDALQKAGSSFEQAIRVVYYIKDVREFEKCEAILKKTFGAHPPAGTMIECNLIAPQYKIEIELTALAG